MFSGSTKQWQLGNRDLLGPQSTAPIRDLLRQSTAHAHAVVDQRFGALIGDDISRYAEFLLASAEAILPLEDALTQAGASRILPDWGARKRAQALRDDLDTIGEKPQRRSAVDGIGGEAHQFGMLYVLEGSRLGARILLRGAQASADPRVRAATRYLRHGEGQRFWPTFLSRLESSDAVRSAPSETVAGAQAAFALFAGAGDGAR